MAYAFVRNLRTNSGANLKHFTQIQAAERHAKRLDLTSAARQRIDGDHRTNYFWSKAGEGLDNGGADYTDAYKAHKTEFEVKSERKNAAIGVHFLVGVSPDWLAETGNPRGLDNSRVTSLIAQAKDWAESWMGDGAVWGVRYDTDESGSGVVDILASPIRQNSSGRGKPKPAISVNKALTELRENYQTRNSYIAMQDSWAEWAKKTLDPQLQRGKPSNETGRQNISPPRQRHSPDNRTG